MKLRVCARRTMFFSRYQHKIRNYHFNKMKDDTTENKPQGTKVHGEKEGVSRKRITSTRNMSLPTQQQESSSRV